MKFWLNPFISVPKFPSQPLYRRNKQSKACRALKDWVALHFLMLCFVKLFHLPSVEKPESGIGLLLPDRPVRIHNCSRGLLPNFGARQEKKDDEIHVYYQARIEGELCQLCKPFPWRSLVDKEPCWGNRHRSIVSRNSKRRADYSLCPPETKK